MDVDEQPQPIKSTIKSDEWKHDSRHVIQPGKILLLKLPSGTIKTIDANSTTSGKIISLGRYGSFVVDDLYGQPFGLAYEIVYDNMAPASVSDQDDPQKRPGRIVPCVDKTLEEIEETEATNELISSTGVQGLTHDEIDALRAAGRSGRDIIEAQINSHAAFDLKTEYSKHKYRQRKEQKYLHFFTPLPPTIYSIADAYFSTNPARTLELRTDTLAQMLTLGNISPGARVLVVESTSGLLTAAILERLGGVGTCLHIHEHVSDPALPVMEEFGFSISERKPLSFINWACTEKEYQPVFNVEEPKSGTFRNFAEKVKHERRRDALQSLQDTRQNFWEGNWDCVLIASTFEPRAVIRRLKPYLAGSAQIVVYHPVMDVLKDLHEYIRNDVSFLGVALTSSNLRRYQVLPGRTHPIMQGTRGSGYLLSATKVLIEQSLLQCHQ